jgi:polysaccharide biosynthesis/export protein
MIFSLIFLTSCTGQRICSYNIVGADEFVLDSYQIRQGKQAILEMTGVCLEPLTPEDLKEWEDVITEGDVLNIAVYHPLRSDLMKRFKEVNQLQGGFEVREGIVHFPDIEAQIIVNLTLEEARQKIQEVYRTEYGDICIYLNYHHRPNNQVEMLGLSSIHSFPVDGRLRLYELLSRAKIAPEANLHMSYLLRGGKILSLDFYRLIHCGDMEQNIVLRGGDKVFIANKEDAKCVILGEVSCPTAIALPYGFMPLSEALVAAKGIPFTGDRRHIQVIRGDLRCPKIYVLSWDHVVQLPNSSLLLMPGDTVYVSEKPITQWNRFISQLLPSFTYAQTACGTYRLFF